MAHVRIITDVTATLTQEVIDRYRIAVLPVDFSFGDEVLIVRDDTDRDRLMQRMATRAACSASATIPASRFQQTYAELTRETGEILVLVAARALSGAFAEARAAAQEFLGRSRVVVMDTMATSWGLGLVVEVAARLASEGAALDEVVRRVRGILPHVYFAFFVERLDYLERGGRLDAAQALLGSMLHIKALLLMEDGDIVPLEKVRTRVQAIEKLTDFVAEFAQIERVVLLKSPIENEVNGLLDDLRRELQFIFPTREFPEFEYDVILAAHLGPEAIGVMVYEGE
ncbi:MAG: DegV family protein [Anaerolineae bacterium]|nr:DegV family protein [Anaerolineae bacterium]